MASAGTAPGTSDRPSIAKPLAGRVLRKFLRAHERGSSETASAFGCHAQLASNSSEWPIRFEKLAEDLDDAAGSQAASDIDGEDLAGPLVDDREAL